MRYTKIAAAAVAILLLGTISVAMFSPQPGRAGEPQAEGSVAQLPLESWYFPAQYVNQATAIEEQIHEFY
jgi:hypothetical protein